MRYIDRARGIRGGVKIGVRRRRSYPLLGEISAIIPPLAGPTKPYFARIDRRQEHLATLSLAISAPWIAVEHHFIQGAARTG